MPEPLGSDQPQQPNQDFFERRWQGSLVQAGLAEATGEEYKPGDEHLEVLTTPDGRLTTTVDEAIETHRDALVQSNHRLSRESAQELERTGRSPAYEKLTLYPGKRRSESITLVTMAYYPNSEKPSLTDPGPMLVQYKKGHDLHWYKLTRDESGQGVLAKLGSNNPDAKLIGPWHTAEADTLAELIQRGTPEKPRGRVRRVMGRVATKSS